MNQDLHFKLIKPDKSLDSFVESYWLLQNSLDSGKEVIVLPDGRIDLILSKSKNEPFRITLLGISTLPERVMIAGKTTMFVVSFKLPAIEYIFQNPISILLNSAQNLPDNFWNFGEGDLNDFDLFHKKVLQKIQSLLINDTDNRKQKLFELIYASNGEAPVSELSKKVYWSSRQINRYFKKQFGLSLKSYCNILRFRASFQHIKKGKVFPEQNFADQSHFIREVKRLSGALPKELRQNQNDRFIQFSTLTLK